MNTDSVLTINMNSNISTINTSMITDTMSDDPSSPESDGGFDNPDLLNDDVTSQLAAAGPIGVAAAAAIATGRKRKRPHSFETNPSIRKRQQTRLLRKLKATIEEYTTRVGQQAVVVCCTPKNTSSSSFKVFGSQPLESVMRNCNGVIMQDLEAALAQQAPPAQAENPALHELPPLNIDGIPTPVDKMTQAQLRAFIPEMLKYSTGRSKPGWGKAECRPVWWPNDVPWANVRSDVRTEIIKKTVSWTHALRTIVKNCYKHHGREDLLPEFHEDSMVTHHQQPHFAPTMVQTINNPDGTVSIIQIDTGDGTTPQVVTLADGTQAQVVHTVGDVIHAGHEATQAVQTLAEVAAHQQDGLNHTPVSVEMNVDTGQPGVTINSSGQIILTGDASALTGDGDNKLITGMVTIPVSMYQTVVTSIAQLQEAQAQGVQVAVVPTQIATQNCGQQSDSETEQSCQPTTQNGAVPDATQAVEVSTVEDIKPSPKYFS